MLFNSWEYIFFLTGVSAIFFSLPIRFRVYFLLTASYYFYMQWDWKFVFLIAFITVINFEAGRRIAETGKPAKRRFWLFAALALSLGLLGYFKYYNFFGESMSAVFDALGLEYMIPYANIILPVGISFFTFQALSYTIDVYRGAHSAEPSLARFALYVAFFPQLVAGPIERATTLLDQFKEHHRFDIDRLSAGVKLIIWGLFKKIVIADRLSLYVDEIYANPELHSGSTLLLANYFFAIQIYCDFSAYSDIAIGSACILGYRLQKNFNLPYFATSISDFWRRWHISLTQWFRAYVYLPLGGNQIALGRWTINVTIVFLLSGLWHGAAWTFVIWGALHATYYLIERGWRALVPNPSPGIAYRTLTMFITFHAVVLAWVFFRAANIDDAMLIVTRILTDLSGLPDWGSSKFTMAINIALVLCLFAIQTCQARGIFSLYFSPSRIPRLVYVLGYTSLLAAIALFGASSSAFIYFQF